MRNSAEKTENIGFFGLRDFVHFVDQNVDERVGTVHVELLHGLLVDLPVHLGDNST